MHPRVEKAMSLIEDSYSKYLTREYTTEQFCDNLATAIQALPLKRFESYTANEQYVENRYIKVTVMTPNSFFGVRVFPSMDTMYKIAKETLSYYDKYVSDDDTYGYRGVQSTWTNSKSWIIEVDSSLLDVSHQMFSPKQFTALLLHELGRVIYSDEVIGKYFTSMKSVSSPATSQQRNSMQAASHLFAVPLALACSQRSWKNEVGVLSNEILADNSVKDLGYLTYLQEALTKIIKLYGDVNATGDTLQTEIDSKVLWCFRNAVDVSKRKDSIKDQLYYIGVKSDSNMIKLLTIDILNSLGAVLHERYTGHVVECSLDILNEGTAALETYSLDIDGVKFAKYEALMNCEISAMESIFNRRKKIKAVLPSQYEVDTILVEIDRIENQHDRIFVLDLIYALLEKVSIFEEAVSLDKQLLRRWTPKIQSMRTQLDVFRKAVLEKKIAPKDYGIFVKLPAVAKDYEG